MATNIVGRTPDFDKAYLALIDALETARKEGNVKEVRALDAALRPLDRYAIKVRLPK